MSMMYITLLPVCHAWLQHLSLCLRLYSMKLPWPRMWVLILCPAATSWNSEPSPPSCLSWTGPKIRPGECQNIWACGTNQKYVRITPFGRVCPIINDISLNSLASQLSILKVIFMLSFSTGSIIPTYKLGEAHIEKIFPLTLPTFFLRSSFLQSQASTFVATTFSPFLCYSADGCFAAEIAVHKIMNNMLLDTQFGFSPYLTFAAFYSGHHVSEVLSSVSFHDMTSLFLLTLLAVSQALCPQMSGLVLPWFLCPTWHTMHEQLLYASVPSTATYKLTIPKLYLLQTSSTCSWTSPPGCLTHAWSAMPKQNVTLSFEFLLAFPSVSPIINHLVS